MAEHIETGKKGEDLAVKHLESLGFTIYDRNYNYERTEVDIVAFIENELHFVEVKTRRGGDFLPESAVTKDKQKRIIKTAQFYLWERQFVTLPAVFDIMAVDLSNEDEPEIKLFEDAFRPESSF